MGLNASVVVFSFAIILIGFTTAGDLQTVDYEKGAIFFHGLKEGYNTMDLLAAFFFSSTILHILKNRQKDTSSTPKGYINLALYASVIAAFLLAVVYMGFSYLAAIHAGSLDVTGKDELLSAITMKLAGGYGGLLVCITVTLACLTTAIALISAFTDFMQKEVFQDRVGYEAILGGALLFTFIVSTFEFTAISAFLGPILQICYPGLIVLTILNIAYRLKQFKPIKTPVFLAFVLSTCFFILEN